MKSTKGKDTLQTRLSGDQERATWLAEALALQERHDDLTHGFHTYPAGLHPLAARRIISELGGEVFLDPFCGGGTTLVEALTQGMRVHGRDISGVALLVARTRTTTATEEQLTAVRSAARKMTARAQKAPGPVHDFVLREVGEWYAPHVLLELQSLREDLDRYDGPLPHLLWAAFSSLLIKVSWRRSDTSARMHKHRRPPGTTSVLFHKKVRELARRVTELTEAVPEGTPPADVARADARTLELEGGADLVVTSPPYPSVYDYLSLQSLREFWLQTHSERHLELGSRSSWRKLGPKRARRQWATGNDAWIQRMGVIIRPGGHLVIVVGDGLVASGPIDTERPTHASALDAGFEHVATASLARPDHARGTMRWEHVMMYRMPG